MKKLILVILLCATILFGASFALKDVAQAKAQEEHLWLMQTLLPGSETFTLKTYSAPIAA